MRRIQRLAIPVVALSLFLVACGSDSDTASDETTVDTSAEVITDDTMVDDSASAKIDITALGLIKEGAITVCTDAPYEPFEFQDEATKEWTGFDMDLMKVIATNIGGLSLEVTVQPFDGIWLAPKAKTCDLVASAMTITEERAANALFSDPYFDADQSLLVRAEDKATLVDLASLAGKTIAVQTGTTGETYAKENAKDSTLKSFDEPAAMFLALEGKQVDAILQDLPVNGARQVKEPTKFALTATFTTGEQYGFALAQDNTTLAEAVNSGLAAAKDSGEYDTIFAKYFGAKG
ncbi:MAG: transporter substrate-binding domain-containing protein [Actinobacteria bacterium]|jgi:polar amino acid transport system substrate-binding protein|nr:transporter substrate-binding domain-containing protein [Actinomycetota bacterium]